MSAAMQGASCPPRWTQLRPHEVQAAYWRSPHRFNVVPSGRRSGKTELFKRKLVRRALSAATPWAPRFFAGAPTRDQAKKIYWDDLKALVGRDMMARPPMETELTIRCVGGAEIVVVGLDKPERIEGSPWDGGGLDEFANMKEKTWTAHVRPALSDRLGWCDFIGVPEGRNHYWGLYTNAVAEMAERGERSAWGAFHWKSADILPADEVEAARRDLDELTFAQEYEGSFVNFEGRAYYKFDRAVHCRPLAYDPRLTLALCFDFNVEPGVCAYVQEQDMPGPVPELDARGRPTGRSLTGTHVVGEAHIPRNSNTVAICRRVIADFKDAHRGRVVCYGDATGGARGSAKVDGSDWDLIERELRPVFKERLSFKVKDANPAERARVNAVNTRLQSAGGLVRMLVDPKKAPRACEDLDGVTLLEGGSGEIDKDAAPNLTHMSDAVGYYVEYEFPVVAGFAAVGLGGM